MNDSKVLKLRTENENLTKLLELSYSEMQNLSELIERRELLKKAIFNASQDTIIILDSFGQIIEFNKNLETLTSYNELQIQGKKITQIINNGTLHEELNQFFDQNTGASSLLNKIHRAHFINKSNLTFDFLCTLKEIFLSTGVNYILYIHDITQELAAEKELEANRALLISSSKMSALGEMSSGIAHEINTPLAIIQMRTDQLLSMLEDNNLDDDTAKKALLAIDSTIKRITKIINGLKSFSRDGRQDPVQQYNLIEIIENTFVLCKEKFKNHNIEIIFEKELFSVFENTQIPCRPSEVSQVLLNLLNNAYDAIENNQEKWIKINLLKTEEKAIIQIIDSGFGIPSDLKEKVMQPFFTTKPLGKGTGLGLSISKGLMQAMNGDLVYNDNLHNTCFELHFIL